MTEKPLKVIEHLSIDDKWGIAYDSSFNDSPLYFLLVTGSLWTT